MRTVAGSEREQTATAMFPLSICSNALSEEDISFEYYGAISAPVKLAFLRFFTRGLQDRREAAWVPVLKDRKPTVRLQKRQKRSGRYGRSFAFKCSSSGPASPPAIVSCSPA